MSGTYIKQLSSRGKYANKVLDFDVEPIILNSRSMVPLRGIFEDMGVDVKWDGNTKTVICTKEEKEVVVQINNEKAYVNGNELILDSVPVIRNSRTLIPLRFISESLGVYVDWDSSTRTAIVSTK